MGFAQIQVELQEWMGSDRAIAESAWTSSTLQSAKSVKTDADVARIVNMLATERHRVPFESVVLRFWSSIPIFTDRQIMTHRWASHNGMSGRYRTMPLDYYYLPLPLNSILERSGVDLDLYDRVCREANNAYSSCISKLKESKGSSLISEAEFKRARELVRGMLPQSNMTERTTTINLRSFANMVCQRTAEYAQPEIRHQVSLMKDTLIQKEVCPIACRALEAIGWDLDGNKS